MSAIYKLSIQGIRSFDSNERETIEFGKPLTLIVGSNGSGKTTIIECLKYATTGDLPPNSKGGAFVHDPKITGEKDVRAQVKLAFTSPNDVSMIVTRNIQLLVKKTSNTFKTLEGQLVAINKGERTTLSSRAAELDTQVPLYMGVPKAILDYVVFCHQEDSLWPLSEPSNLKKRFDEIFQAMKFTKALDNLKTIKKDMAVDIKLLKQSVEHLKLDRDRSRATKINISTLEKRVEEYKAQAKQVDEQLDEITEQSDRLFKSNQEFQQVLSKMEGLQHSQNSLKEQITRIESTIEPLDLSRSELETLLNNFSHALEEKKVRSRDLERELHAKRLSMEETRGYYNALISHQGELKARKSAYEADSHDLKNLIKQLNDEDGLIGEDILSDLGSMLQSSRTKLDTMSAENAKRLEALRNQISDLESQRIKQEQHLIYCENDKEKLAGEINNLEMKLKSMANVEEELHSEENNLQSFQERLNNQKIENEISGISAQIKSSTANMLVIEDDLEKNQRELLKVNEQADLHARFTILKQSLEKKTQDLSSLKSKLHSDEKATAWKLAETSDLDLEFRSIHVGLQKKITVLTREHSQITKRVTEKEFLQAQLKEQFDSNSSKISALDHKIIEALPEDCSIDEYPVVLQESEESYRIAVENLKMHKTTVEFNLKALEVAKHNNSCYLCQRKFEDAKQQKSMLSELESRTDIKFEETLKSVVSEEKDYLTSLRKLENDVSLLQTMKSSQLELVPKIEKLSQELGADKSLLIESQKNLDNVKKELEHTENILRPVIESTIRQQKEIKALEVEFQSVSDEVRIHSGLGKDAKTSEELQVAQKQMNESLREARKEIGLLQESKEAKSRELSNLLGLVREKTFRVNDLKKQLKEKENVQKSIEEHKKSVKQAVSIGDSVSATLNELSVKLAEVKRLLHSQGESAASEEAGVKAKIDGLQFKVDKLSGLQGRIEEFEKTFASQVGECEGKIKGVTSSLEALSKEIEGMGDQLVDQNQKIKDSVNEEKNLKLNIDLVMLRKELEKVDSELSKLNIQNAEAQRDKYQQESSRLRSLFEKLSSDNAGRMGEVKQLQNQIRSLMEQLESDYKDVDITYQKEWVQLQTKTLVTDDIEIYSKALDSAIMRYHSLKMQDINRIIDELWKRTYSGTDVDTIKIKSDEVTTSTRGKSYNYRVVMYKQDAELDMRGRCSAGQKVLASIIVRLALSETFGVNCGVIALDEPTTNLDEENIESLAKSLNNIIEFRRHQRNFQLIVITHDEKFLRYMGAADFADHFYKVKRDDRQKSQIEWVDITKVTS